jgi:hypothetical protein
MGLLDLADRVLGASDPMLEAWQKPQPVSEVRDLADELQTARLTGTLLGRPADYTSLEHPALRRAEPYLTTKRYMVTDRGEFERMSRSVLRMDADVKAGRLADTPEAIADRLRLDESLSYLAKAATPKTQRGDFRDLSPDVDADRTWRVAVAIATLSSQDRHAVSQGRFDEVPRRQLRLMTQTVSPAPEAGRSPGLLSKARDAIAPGRTPDRAQGMDPRKLEAFRRYDESMRDASPIFAPWAEGKPGSADRTRWIKASFEEATRSLFATDGPNPALIAAIDAQALYTIGSRKPIGEELEEVRSRTAGYVAHFVGRDPDALSASIAREARGLAFFGDEQVAEQLPGSVQASTRDLPSRDLDDGVSRASVIADLMKEDSRAAAEGRMDPVALVKRSVSLVWSGDEKIDPADPVKVAASVPPFVQVPPAPFVSAAKGPGVSDDHVLAAGLSSSKGASR